MPEQGPSSIPAPTPAPTPSPTSTDNIKMGPNLESDDSTSSPTSAVVDSSQEHVIRNNISGNSGHQPVKNII